MSVSTRRRRRVFGTNLNETFVATIASIWSASEIWVNMAFNETSGTTFDDSGTDNKDGTLAFSTTGPIMGRPGRGLETGAADKAVTFVTDSALQQRVTRSSPSGLGRPTATKGMLGVVMAYDKQESAVIKIVAEQCDSTSVALPTRIGIQFDASGFLRVSFQKRGTSGSRNWLGAIDYRNTGPHFFAVVQRADGTGVHCFVDGSEVSMTMSTGGTPPTIDAWFSELTGGSLGADSVSGFMWDTRSGIGGQGYTAGTLCHFVSIDGATVTDANISALAATIPTATDQYWYNNFLVAHNDGANNGTTFTDSTSQQTFTRVNTPVTSTAQVKYGSASALFNGSADGILVNALDASVAWGTDDMTIEAWVYRTATGNIDNIFSSEVNGTGVAYRFSIAAAGEPYLLTRGPGGANLTVVNSGGATKIGANVWYHLCAMRKSNVCYVFIDGVLQASAAVTDNMTAGLRTSYGYDARNSNEFFHGYIDDLRVTLRAARYSIAGFTPPTAAHPDGPVL